MVKNINYLMVCRVNWPLKNTLAVSFIFFSYFLHVFIIIISANEGRDVKVQFKGPVSVASQDLLGGV
jgi:hypothetical protein